MKVLIADQQQVATLLSFVAEIGEVPLGRAKARTAPDEITLFKSPGIAIEDLAAARHVFDKAQERGLGTWIEIGGRHFGSAAEE